MNRSEKRFYAPDTWNAQWTAKAPYADLGVMFRLLSGNQVAERELAKNGFPDTEYLNQLAQDKGFNDYVFVANQKLESEEGQYARAAGLYYEEIIHEFHWIPTREKNWHDWFNALIWLCFPKTKQCLNQLHMQDIQAHGLHPRSKLRNRITLFDECGGVLVYENRQHLEALMNHQWHQAFIDMRKCWHRSTKYFVFGHANYEMLLSPYVGLTGKYFPVKVDSQFWDFSLTEQYSWIDEHLSHACQKGEVFDNKTSLKPLPLLGIPGWWQANEDPTFYQNDHYFRAKRQPG